MISEYFRSIKKLIIQGKPYKIIWQKMIFDGEEGLETKFYGKVSTAKQEITLAENLAIEKLFDTMFHEIVHAIDNELVLDLDEKTVDRLATGFAEAVILNFNIEPIEDILE